MFYYSWLLGLPMAVFFAVLISIWYEIREENAVTKKK
ncbi:MAG: cytochrome bd-I oxidase subunit CydX [Saezia sp.]